MLAWGNSQHLCEATFGFPAYWPFIFFQLCWTFSLYCTFCKCYALLCWLFCFTLPVSFTGSYWRTSQDYSRKLLFYSKEQSLYCYKELWLKTSRKERSNWRLLLPGSTRTIPELFDKKMWTKNRRVFTALDLTECWEMVREWVYLFLQTVKKRLPKSETSQSDPEWKGNIVLHFGRQGLH